MPKCAHIIAKPCRNNTIKNSKYCNAHHKKYTSKTTWYTPDEYEIPFPPSGTPPRLTHKPLSPPRIPSAFLSDIQNKKLHKSLSPPRRPSTFLSDIQNKKNNLHKHIPSPSKKLNMRNRIKTPYPVYSRSGSTGAESESFSDFDIDEMPVNNSQAVNTRLLLQNAMNKIPKIPPLGYLFICSFNFKNILF